MHHGYIVIVVKIIVAAVVVVVVVAHFLISSLRLTASADNVLSFAIATLFLTRRSPRTVPSVRERLRMYVFIVYLCACMSGV